jgi:hypothetical protein
MADEIKAGRAIDLIAEHYPELIVFDQIDDAIVGIGTVNQVMCVIYDEATVIEILTTEFDNDRETAVEWFEYNISQAYVGEGTPVFMTSITTLEEQYD